MKSLHNSALRLVLLNQYKILSLLDEDNADYYNYYKDIIVEGIEKKYPILLETIGFGGSEVPVEVSDGADLILEIFNKVQYSIEKMNLNAQRDIKEKYHIYFDGFNINNETERPYYTYINFVRKHKEVTFPDVGDGRNRLTLYHYKQMMNNYMEYRDHEILNEEKIRKICIRKGEEISAYEAILMNFPETGPTPSLQFVKEDKTYQSE
ncbi:YfbU family protein [Salinicoccus sp. HZC-1]|uniref:YfbU family protein n=1 Tax=Salinicoccus sp. HZC-1 TaxID=3385497 RepID=UPI00398BAE41